VERERDNDGEWRRGTEEMKRNEMDEERERERV
jgi:hypothetical protein